MKNWSNKKYGSIQGLKHVKKCRHNQSLACKLSRAFPPFNSFVTDSDEANVLHRSIKFELNSIKSQTLVLLQGWPGDQLHAAETFHKYCYIMVSLRIRPSPHYAIHMTWRNNNHRPCWICVWGKLVPENHMIVMTRYWFQKTSFS